MTLGERIKIARQDKGLSQDDLAEMMGVETATISRWETNSTNVRPSNFVQLAKVLGKPVEWFRGEEPVSKDLVDRISAIEERLKALPTHERRNHDLSDDEIDLVEIFRLASPKTRKLIFDSAKSLIQVNDGIKAPHRKTVG